MRKEIVISLIVSLGGGILAGSNRTGIVNPNLSDMFDQTNPAMTLNLSNEQLKEMLEKGYKYTVDPFDRGYLNNPLVSKTNQEPSLPVSPAVSGKELPTPIPETPWNQLENIDFSKPERILLVFKLFLGGKALTLETNFLPVVRPTNPDALEKYFMETSPGLGTAGIFQDIYGNRVITGHSGYDPNNCQSIAKCVLEPFEQIRYFLQGRNPPFVWKQTLPIEDIPNSDDDQPGHAALLLGGSSILSQGANKLNLKPVALGIIPHEWMNAYNSDSGGILNYVRNPAGGPNPDFDRFRHQPGGVLVSFSGWKEPIGSNWAQHTEDETPWYSHFAYVIGFQVKK